MRKIAVLLMILLVLVTMAAAFAQEGTEEPTDEVTPPTVIVVTDEPTEEPTGIVVTSEPTDEATVEPTMEVTVEPTMEVTDDVTPTATPVIIQVTPVPPFKVDTTPRIAVISAYAPEIEALLAQTSVDETHTFNGVDFMTGQIAGQDVVVFMSGVSMVNAAMNTQLVLDRFNITHIIFSGIAGGVNPGFNIGDVVVPEQWAQYQESIAARELEDGTFAPPAWASAPFPNFTFLFPQTINVRTEDAPEGEEVFWFPVDPDMLAVAQSVAGRVSLVSCNVDNVCLDAQPVVRVGGSGVSGQTFVDNAEYREYVFNTFGADALDMETAAAAHVAYANGVPFIAFRSLSDLAGGGPGENEIGTFFGLAAGNSATVTVAFLEAWEG